jgi:plasmid stability protein
MSQVLVRDLDPAVVERLKARAQRSGRSLQSELKLILEQAASSNAEIRVVAERFARRLANRRHTDSAVLLAEDRRR